MFDIGRVVRCASECDLPQAPPGGNVRQRKIDKDIDSTSQCFVEISAHVAGKHYQIRVRIDCLKQIRRFDVGVLVVCVFLLSTPSEQRIGLIEEKANFSSRGFGEDLRENLFRLADIFRNDRADVDYVEVATEVEGDRFCGQRFAGARRPGKEAADSARRGTGFQTPFFYDRIAVFNPSSDRMKRQQFRGGQYQTIESAARDDTPAVGQWLCDRCVLHRSYGAADAVFR